MIDWLISIANYDALQLLSSVVLQRSSREDFWTCLSAAVGTTYVTTPAHPPCPHTLPILDILLPLADEPQPSRSAVCRAMDEHRLQVRTFICMGAAFSLFLCLQVPFLRVISFPLFLLLSFLSHFHASSLPRNGRLLQRHLQWDAVTVPQPAASGKCGSAVKMHLLCIFSSKYLC